MQPVSRSKEVGVRFNATRRREFKKVFGHPLTEGGFNVIEGAWLDAMYSPKEQKRFGAVRALETWVIVRERRLATLENKQETIPQLKKGDEDTGRAIVSISCKGTHEDAALLAARIAMTYEGEEAIGRIGRESIHPRVRSLFGSYA